MTDTTRTKTRQALIEAAERLLGQNGFSGVTAMEITKKANARNTSAVRYHFGSMENLILAVFERRQTSLEQARKRLIEKLDADGPCFDFEKLLAASIHPLLEACLEEDGRFYVSILHQLTAEPRFNFHELVNSHAPKSVTLIRSRLEKGLSHLPSEVAQHRLQRINLLAVTLVAEFARAQEQGQAQDLAFESKEIATTLAGYLTAVH